MEVEPRFAEVVFDRPLDQAFTYALPDGLSVQVGQRVECPFGRGDRTATGFVVGLRSESPAFATKAILRVADAEPLVDANLLKLTRWLADYYLCGWGQVLQAVVPAGVRSRAGTRATVFIEAVSGVESGVLPAKQQQALERLRSEGGPVKLSVLSRELGGSGAVQALVEKGLARRRVERVETEPVGTNLEPRASVSSAATITLNADQSAAWEVIASALAAGGYQPHLLHGVTGSGKTELYLRAIEQVVAAGREAIVLVPEISLTPQTIERFAGRGRVAVLHSHLSEAERARDWRRIAAGEVDVVVGARSAVFAPTRKLGLIVIDEEHESTYKQDSTPRYHGRDVAVMRARLEGVPIVLGSATPSLESWHNAHRAGGYRLLSLPCRVEARSMPEVRIIDQRHEPKPLGKPSALGETLERGMRSALESGGQVILLLNRRGFNTHIHCPACGHVAQCAHCDLSLTYHRNRSAMLCHYCGYEAAPLANCPVCQAAGIRFQGLGTEKLEEEVAARFAEYALARMDSDTMTKPGSHRRVLEAFREGRTRILLGTQMIAKGLDFPNVTLVGVINADVGLHQPDFRAAERTFQLLAQVAGRAGRGDKIGHVMIQTFNPDHPAIALAARHDYLGFAAMELEHRRSHQYPPFQRLARVVLRSAKESAAGGYAEALAGAFQRALERPAGGEPVRLLGPAECPVFRLNGFFRFHFQIQSASSVRLHEILREGLATAKPPRGVEIQVDVDPQSML